jgi:4-amino-4-deoxy-L-arabinose transferase-like glycosyltransferase
MPLWALAFLALTAAVSLITAHYRVMGGDDLLELWCDKVGSIGQLLHIQRTSPLVIDPFFYHGLTFAGIRIFGVRPFFLRLPSLCGFLLMQVCLFYFVRRITTAHAAMFALAFPAMTGAFGYTQQIRPYGVLLGLFGLAMLSWQTAARRDQHRAAALVVLALSIAAAVNSQYYGVLLMLPLCAGEAVRAWERRRLDVAMLLSMGAGMAGMVFVVPFLKGAAQFRGHYKAGNVPYQSITQTYNFLVLGQGTFSTQTNHVFTIVLGLLTAIVLWSCIRLWRRGSVKLPDAEFVFLLVLAALPVFAFLLGHFVTHAMEARYALGAVAGIAALLAIALAPVLESRVAGLLILAALSVGFVWKGALEVRAERADRTNALAALVISPQVEAAILSSPAQRVYTQDIDLVGFLVFHGADAEVLKHFGLVYSENEEMRWNQSETDSRIVANLKTFTPYMIVPYESVIHEPGEHLFVVTHGGWNWLDKAFASGQLQVTTVGPAFGGEVVSVRAPLAGEGQRVP